MVFFLNRVNFGLPIWLKFSHFGPKNHTLVNLLEAKNGAKLTERTRALAIVVAGK